MTGKSPYVIHPYEQPFYSPAHHTGTRNYRLVGPPTNGSQYLEIALGDIERNEGAPAHAHPDLEQAVYIIEGEATVAIDGIVEDVKTGDLLFYPPQVFHDIKVKSERIKLLVIYAPPFLEAPKLHRDAAQAEIQDFTPTGKSPYVIHPEEQPFYSPANHTGTRNYRLVGPPTNGSKYLEIALGDIERHEGSPAHAHPDLEQAVYIIAGEATVAIDGIVEEVKTGDLLFFPPRVFHDIKVKSERIKLLVIYSPPFLEAPVIHRTAAHAGGE